MDWPPTPNDWATDQPYPHVEKGSSRSPPSCRLDDYHVCLGGQVNISQQKIPPLNTNPAKVVLECLRGSNN